MADAAVEELERHRPELTRYCYGMLGSPFDADDAVQETMVRAWRSSAAFEGRSSLRTWVYRIATNVCLDLLAGRGRRARPVDLSAPAPGPLAPGDAPGAPRASDVWIEPWPERDPADVVLERESVRLAFVAALQGLAPRQRAVLLLRDVLLLPARDVAELMGTTTASVNSALQRARTATAARSAARTPSATPAPSEAPAPPCDVQLALAARYAEAFERFDMAALAMLLHVDAALSLTPYPVWLRGPDAVRSWFTGPGVGCRGSRLVPVLANGAPAYGQYRPCADGTGYVPWALHVLDIAGERIAGISTFLDTDRFFPRFGLPDRLDG